MSTSAPTGELPAKPASQPSLEPFEQLPAHASLETDVLCTCGYNLHGQFVRRDPRTQLLLVKCPECGSFTSAAALAPAGRAWLERFSVWLGGVWVVLVATVLLGAPVVQMGVHFSMMDELRWMTGRENSAWTVALMIYTVLNAASGFVFMNLLMACLPHWRKRMYLLYAIPASVLGSVGAAAVFEFASIAHRHFYVVSIGHRELVLIFLISNVLGLGLAWQLGRRTVRLLVRIALPPWLRGMLAYLWRVDGLVPPGGKAD